MLRLQVLRTEATLESMPSSDFPPVSSVAPEHASIAGPTADRVLLLVPILGAVVVAIAVAMARAGRFAGLGRSLRFGLELDILPAINGEDSYGHPILVGCLRWVPLTTALVSTEGNEEA